MTYMPNAARPRQRATVRDVAERAEVSVSTVSRALSGARVVNPELKARIIAISNEMGYKPNQIAASLRRNTTETVGFVVPDITNPFFPSLIEALETHLREQGVALLLANSNNDPALESLAINSLLHRNVDALFVSPSHRERSRETLESAVNFGRIIQVDRFASPDFPYVGVDQRAGIQMLVDHLTQLGHGELGFVGANDSEWPTHNREQAYRAVAGTVSGQRVLSCESTIAAGRAIGTDLPRIWPGVFGIVCANDLVAFGVQRGIAEAHPELATRFTITGFDNTVLSEAGSFTSVQQPINDVAREAISILTSATPEGTGDGIPADTPPFIELAAELIIRS
jgi:LacI family transcriptional regulator